MTAPLPVSANRFRAEADMLAHLATSTLFTKRMHALFEVPCTAGVPDIVFVEFDEAALAERSARPALTDMAELRVMMMAACGGSRVLREWTAADEQVDGFAQLCQGHVQLPSGHEHDLPGTRRCPEIGMSVRSVGTPRHRDTPIGDVSFRRCQRISTVLRDVTVGR
ncbi:hypothetical protein [Nocardia sp. NPDC050710]|uniref:hypothetical protein n=1 Tax=Nocardia sp. NPDC050710 TaxID=3157220 RepID=UPI00340695D5